MKTRTKSISYDIRVRTFWSLAAIALLSIGLYMYAVNATVTNTLARRTLENKAAALSANIGDRQFGLIAAEEKISLATAYAAGFEDASNPLYISRAPALSMNIPSRP